MGQIMFTETKIYLKSTIRHPYSFLRPPFTQTYDRDQNIDKPIVLLHLE